MITKLSRAYLTQRGVGWHGMLLAAVAFFLAIGAAVPGQAQVIYSSIIQPLQGNPAFSAGPEAFGYRELGDGLVFTPGSPRQVSAVKVLLSSFACTSGAFSNPLPGPNACVTTPGATFSQPITLNIRSVNPDLTPGPLLKTVTQIFKIPYRPSSQPQCPDGTSYFNATDNTCDHGISALVTFDLSSMPVIVPDRAVVSFTFNTTTAGYAPIGTGAPCFSTSAGCPYDSLNISTDSSAIIGANVDPNGIYVNWINPASSCTGTESGALLLDTPCWTGLHPEIEVDATSSDVFQVSYAANLGVGDSIVNITNTGAASTVALPTQNGNICANVYTFSPDEQLVSCCTCLITPNGLASLSVNNDLVNNTLTPGRPTSIVIKLLASSATGAGGTACNASLATLGTVAPGLAAFGTTIHALPVTPQTPATTFGVTEKRFVRATLSSAELQRITSLCGFIQITGSGFGICRSCRLGGQGAAAQK